MKTGLNKHASSCIQSCHVTSQARLVRHIQGFFFLNISKCSIPMNLFLMRHLGKERSDGKSLRTHFCVQLKT